MQGLKPAIGKRTCRSLPAGPCSLTDRRDGSQRTHDRSQRLDAAFHSSALTSHLWRAFCRVVSRSHLRHSAEPSPRSYLPGLTQQSRFSRQLLSFGLSHLQIKHYQLHPGSLPSTMYDFVRSAAAIVDSESAPHQRLRFASPSRLAVPLTSRNHIHHAPGSAADQEKSASSSGIRTQLYSS